MVSNLHNPLHLGLLYFSVSIQQWKDPPKGEENTQQL